MRGRCAEGRFVTKTAAQQHSGPRVLLLVPPFRAVKRPEKGRSIKDLVFLRLHAVYGH